MQTENQQSFQTCASRAALQIKQATALCTRLPSCEQDGAQRQSKHSAGDTPRFEHPAGFIWLVSNLFKARPQYFALSPASPGLRTCWAGAPGSNKTLQYLDGGWSDTLGTATGTQSTLPMTWASQEDPHGTAPTISHQLQRWAAELPDLIKELVLHVQFKRGAGGWEAAYRAL